MQHKSGSPGILQTLLSQDTAQAGSPRPMGNHLDHWQKSFLKRWLLALIGSAFAFIAYAFLADDFIDPVDDDFVLTMLSAFATYIVAYWLSQHGKYQFAALLTLGYSSVAVFILALSDRDANNVDNYLIFLVLSTLLSSFLLTIRTTFIIMLMLVTGILSLLILKPAADPHEVLFAALFFLIISSLIMVVMYYRHLLEANRQTLLQRQNEHLAALHETALALMRRQALNDVLTTILQRAAHLAGTAHGSIDLVDSSEKHITVKVGIGVHQTQVGQSTEIGQGHTGRVWQSGEPLTVNDYGHWEGRLTAFDTLNIRALTGIPLKVDGKVRGVISLSRIESSHPFSPQDVANLQQFADLAALVVDKAQNEQALQEYNQTMFALINGGIQIMTAVGLENVLTSLIQVTQTVFPGANRVSVQLADESQDTIRTGYASVTLSNQPLMVFRPHVGIAGHAYAERRVVNVSNVLEDARFIKRDNDDAPPYLSLMVAPMIVGEHVWGTLSISHTQSDSFSKRDEAVIEMLARQAAGVIEKTQLLQAEHDQRRLSEALRDTVAALNSALSLDEVLDQILIHVERVVPHDVANIMFLDETREAARIVRVRGYEQLGLPIYAATLRFDLATFANFRHVAETKRPLVIPNTRTHAEWIPDPEWDWLQSYVCAPILDSHHEILGYLNLDSVEMGHFTEADGERLMTFANEVSVAIEKARLFDQVQRHAAELELRVAERTAELEREQAQLRTILEAMDEGVMYLEQEPEMAFSVIRYVNPSLCHLSGFEAEDVVGKPVRQIGAMLMAPEEFEKLENILQASTAANLSQRNNTFKWTGELAISTKEGNVVNTMVSVIVRLIPQTQVLWAVAIFRDISNEKSLQEQKDRFVANAAHELRTPLSNLVTRVYLLRNQPDHLEEHITAIETTTNRLQELARDLIDITRYQRGVITLLPRPTDITQLVHEAIMFQHARARLKQIQIVTDFPESPAIVTVDPDRIAQVITNLIVNAVSYSPERSKIQVIISHTPEHLLLIVKDSGMGISLEHQETIFEPFFRASEGKVSGTGLGLTISKEIIELHGGKIWVESEVGKGAAFYVQFNRS